MTDQLKKDIQQPTIFKHFLKPLYLKHFENKPGFTDLLLPKIQHVIVIANAYYKQIWRCEQTLSHMHYCKVLRNTLPRYFPIKPPDMNKIWTVNKLLQQVSLVILVKENFYRLISQQNTKKAITLCNTALKKQTPYSFLTPTS